MNPLKSAQKHRVFPKLYDVSAVSHPEADCSLLVDSLVICISSAQNLL